ncbi:hypothetical protein B0H13DRAFT_1926884 [Mycena leptocephala]|nr:hypothetical protein B0H13DRAFT_1926884 [Mycena leptocephala]
MGLIRDTICRPIWLPEDSSFLDRTILFGNLCTLQEAMIGNPGYLELGIDFPNFDLSSTELEWYGIFPFYKACQIALLSATHFRCRKFGGGLLQYNPELGEEGRKIWRHCMGIVLRLECKTFAYLSLRAYRITSSKMPQLVIRRLDGPPSTISRNAHILQELCLPSETLDTLGFTPDEPWSEFFEFRLRPMIYLVHAGVMQDFSLIGCKGVYSLGELEEIQHWVQQALHCRLLLVCRKALQPEYEDNFSVSCPPTWGIPGEAVAMLEIMYRICLSIGFLCSNDSLCPLDDHILLPLIMGAHETRALLKTVDDFSAYNRFGEMVDADQFISGLTRIIKQGHGRASTSDSESSSSKEIHWSPRRNRRQQRWLPLRESWWERTVHMCFHVFGDHPLCSLVLGYYRCSAADILLDHKSHTSGFLLIPASCLLRIIPSASQSRFLGRYVALADCIADETVDGPGIHLMAMMVGKRANTCVMGSVSVSDIFVHQFQTRKASARDSSGSSVSYIDSGSESESDDKDLPDPADLLKTLSAGPSKVIKVEKHPVNAMDVDDEPAAPPPKKVNRSGKGVSTVSNAVESSSQEKLQINDSFDFEVNLVCASAAERMYELHIQDAEEIGKVYKVLEAQDPRGFRQTMERFAAEGFALSCTGEWLLSFGETMGDLVAFFNAVQTTFATFQYQYGIVEPLGPLPSSPDHPIFLDAQDPQPHWCRYTRNIFPPFDGERYILMGNYNDAWKDYKVALTKHEESESQKEAAFMERQRYKFSDLEKCTKEYHEKIPGLHKHQSERILAYIQECKTVICELEMRMNTLGCFILYCLHAQFEDDNCALKGHFPTITSSKTSKKAPVREDVAPPPPPSSIPRKWGKVMSDEPQIAGLKRGSISGSDDVPLSVLRSAKGKGKSKTDAAPTPSSKKKSPVLSDDGESERIGSVGGGSKDEGGDTLGIVTRKVRVKRGKWLVNVEMTGPQNTYNSVEWHQENDLFVFDAPLTSTSSNKIVTHMYPQDEKHPCFSRTWKCQVTLASLPMRSFFTHGKGCVRCSLVESDCICLCYGDNALMGDCMHCCADNVTCKMSPVEFDWEVTDGTLPDINAEFLELQLTLMLEIAEQTQCTIFRSIDSSLATGKFQFRPNPMLREEGNDHTDDSKTEVEVRKGKGSKDVLMDGATGATNKGPSLTLSVSASGESSPKPAPLVCLRMDAVEIPSRAPPPLMAPWDPHHMFLPSPPGSSSTPRKPAPTSLQTPRSSPTVATSSAHSLSTSVFGKAGLLLGAKPNETSEGSAGCGNMLEEGELDAEGEVVVETPAGETLGAGADVNMD